jgi:hypothetical protein
MSLAYATTAKTRAPAKWRILQHFPAKFTYNAHQPRHDDWRYYEPTAPLLMLTDGTGILY